MKEINFYSRDANEYGWLSNFARYKEVVDGVEYLTNEHYYQSQKAKDPEIRKKIAMRPTPFLAMVAGRSIKKSEMIDNWNEKRIMVMTKGLRAKFQNIELREKLLATGDTILHEDSPTDMFWGKKGEDMLGKLLMKIREEVSEISLAKEHPVRKRFQVRENQLTILLETNDKDEAMKTWRESHRKTPSKYHEVYEFWDGGYNGICQFKPGDQVRW